MKWQNNTLIHFFLLPILLAIITGVSPVEAANKPETNVAIHSPIASGDIAHEAMPEKEPFLIPDPPNIKARSYVLMDYYSGKILAAKDPNLRTPPASLTKIMTMYVVSKALKENRIKLDEKVRVSKKAWKTGGSKMFIRVGTQVPVSDLVHGVVVASGNDACVALAEHVAGSEDAFASLMNHQAKALGLTHSHFTDSTGLPHPDHLTTARDMALLARAYIYHFPDYYPWFAQKWFTYNNIKQPNRNRLLWRDPYVDGIKTGHTSSAGYCLVSSAMKNGMRLIAVVMGAPSDNARAEDSQRLLTYGFRFFETHRLYAANKAIARPRVWMGNKENVPVGLTRDLYITIPSGEYNKLKAVINMKTPLKAPIKRGEVVGKITVTLAGHPLLQKPLVALQSNQEGGLLRNLTDKVKMGVAKLLGQV